MHLLAANYARDRRKWLPPNSACPSKKPQLRASFHLPMLYWDVTAVIGMKSVAGPSPRGADFIPRRRRTPNLSLPLTASSSLPKPPRASPYLSLPLLTSVHLCEDLSGGSLSRVQSSSPIHYLMDLTYSEFIAGEGLSSPSSTGSLGSQTKGGGQHCLG